MRVIFACPIETAGEPCEADMTATLAGDKREGVWIEDVKGDCPHAAAYDEMPQEDRDCVLDAALSAAIHEGECRHDAAVDAAIGRRSEEAS